MVLIIFGILTYIAITQTGVPFDAKVMVIASLGALILWVLFGGRPPK